MYSVNGVQLPFELVGVYFALISLWMEEMSIRIGQWLPISTFESYSWEEMRITR